MIPNARGFDAVKPDVCDEIAVPVWARPLMPADVKLYRSCQLPYEGYMLDIAEDGTVTAICGEKGEFSAISAIRQTAVEAVVRPLHMTDAPKYRWRSMHIDVCRHFFPISTLHKLIDLMAIYRLNRLHFHISDDQGFRFDSEKFPRLTEVGSKRPTTHVKLGSGEVQDGVPHGGFYTKAELRSLVAYAMERGIDIMPEVDIPGHTTAIIASYPELGCGGRDTAVETGFGIKDFSAHILCAGNPKVYEFLFGLLDELMDVFPSEYIHIGGDEAVKTEWRKCPACQAERLKLGLRDERELQGHMLRLCAQHIASRGRKAVVWNDGLAESLGHDVICQHWTPPAMEGDRRTKRHMECGGKAYFSGFRYTYLDYPYAMTPMKKVYRYKPLPKGLSESAAANMLGMECCLWTEWIRDERKLFYNLLPRLAAFAENAWGSNIDYADFLARLAPHYEMYEAMGLPYAKGREKPGSPLARLIATYRFFLRDAETELK